MITVLSGTNRAGSNTLKVSKTYFDILQKRDIESQLFTLEDLPLDFISPQMYGNPTREFDDLQKKYLFPTSHFFIVTPEYNGTFAGILKTVIDASDIASSWRGKKVCLTGVAAGRAGGLRALDHLTNQMHHMKALVFNHKIPFSGINALLNDEGQFINERDVELIESQVDGFLKF